MTKVASGIPEKILEFAKNGLSAQIGTAGTEQVIKEKMSKTGDTFYYLDLKYQFRIEGDMRRIAAAKKNNVTYWYKGNSRDTTRFFMQ